MALLLLAFFPGMVLAQEYNEDSNLIASDAAAVSVSIGTAFVGPCILTPLAAGAGEKLIAADGESGDVFGAVAVEGDTMVVGAPHDDSSRGAAYVFTRNGGTWTQQAKLTATDGAANDLFGYSASISGDIVVLGAVWHDVGPNGEQGSAYVFVRPGGGWMNMT